eukprot:Phypoly_transcript_11997.p1 GENE.Phypoly_transcript_11997~~Phypoly_transcript_11997.p1  ORF type:complete len:314 (+),score=65.12 Phypoly_transcript_11997:198-1139(+)
MLKYIFYVPPNAESQFKEVFSQAPLPSTTIEKRVYSPKAPITNVTQKDYVVLCIDMCQISRIGDYDGEYNVFLTQCAAYGDKVSVLLKGAPKELNFQRWMANKGKLLSDLDDSGRLWSWESISEEAESGIFQSNKLKRFMRAVKREDKNKQKINTKFWVLILVAIALVLFSYKLQDVKETGLVVISSQNATIQGLSTEKELLRQNLEDTELFIDVRSCLQTKIDTLNATLAKSNEDLAEHQRRSIAPDTDESPEELFAKREKIIQNIASVTSQLEKVSGEFKILEEVLATEEARLAYVAKNRPWLEEKKKNCT